MAKSGFSEIIIWRTIQGVGQQVIQFIVSIVLARILFPEDYGKIAVLTIFFVISNTLIDSGLGVALVREKNIKSLDFDTVFTFNLIMAISLYSLLFFSAPLIANFYDEKELTLLTRVVGIKILINSFSIINYSRLRRELKMKTIAVVTIYSISLGGLVAIFMAYKGYGVWAIVIQQLVMSLVLFFGYNFYTKKMAYKVRFSRESFRKLFSFGGYLLMATLVSRASDQMYALLIGKSYTMGDVGYFNRAQTLHSLPIVTINKSIAEGATPKLYRMQDNVKEMVEKAREILRLINFIAFPLIAIMFVLSEEIVLFLLTNKWIAIVPFFNIFLIAALFYSHNYFSQIIFKTVGKSKIVFRVQLISKILLIIMLISAVNHSIMALVWCSVITGIFLLLLNMYYLKKVVGYNYKNLLSDYKFELSTSIIILFLILFIHKIIVFDYLIIDLTVKTTIGFVSYFGLNLLIKNKIMLMLRDKLRGNNIK